WPEELRGFKKALGSINLYDFLTLEALGTRFMRVGKKPPLRATVVMLTPRNYLIYTLGYIPYFRDYRECEPRTHSKSSNIMALLRLKTFVVKFWRLPN